MTDQCAFWVYDGYRADPDYGFILSFSCPVCGTVKTAYQPVGEL